MCAALDRAGCVQPYVLPLNHVVGVSGARRILHVLR